MAAVSEQDVSASEAPWMQVLSLQQQVAAQMANVVESLQGQATGSTPAIARELVMLFDFIEQRLSAVGHQEDPRWQELVSVRSRLLEILSKQGMKRLTMDDFHADPSSFQPALEVDTRRPEEDGMVLRVLREGFRWGDAIFRPAEVEIARYTI